MTASAALYGALNGVMDSKPSPGLREPETAIQRVYLPPEWSPMDATIPGGSLMGRNNDDWGPGISAINRWKVERVAW